MRAILALRLSMMLIGQCAFNCRVLFLCRTKRHKVDTTHFCTESEVVVSIRWWVMQMEIVLKLREHSPMSISVARNFMTAYYSFYSYLLKAKANQKYDIPGLVVWVKPSTMSPIKEVASRSHSTDTCASQHKGPSMEPPNGFIYRRT